MPATKNLDGKQWCKYCETWRLVGEFRPQRKKCDRCRNAANRKTNKANAKRRDYFREYQAKMRAAHRLMPTMLAAIRAIVSGDTARAERLAKIAYAEALREGIA